MNHELIRNIVWATIGAIAGSLVYQMFTSDYARAIVLITIASGVSAGTLTWAFKKLWRIK